MLKKLFNFDWILIITVFFLVSISVLAIYSFSTDGQEKEFSKNIFLKQFTFVILGVGMMFFFAFVDYHYFQFYARSLYFLIIALLSLVLLWGNVIRGTAGWISFGPFNLQPVEFAKLVLIIFIASFIARKKSKIGELGRVVISFIFSIVIIFLILKQPDFGSAAVLLSIWFGMIIISGINWKLMTGVLVVGIFSLIWGWFLLAPYQKERIINFINPNSNAQSTGYNVIQSLVAVGSGGITGKGIGSGSQSYLNFLPEKHTDFIFAAISEELGLTGAVIVLFLYFILSIRIKKIANGAVDNFGFLLATGIMIMIFSQVFINIGMNIGIVPVAGIPLPFLSYGGSSLISLFIAMGILLNVSQKEIISSRKIMQSY